MVSVDNNVELSSCVCAPPVKATARENFSVNPQSIEQSFQVWLQGMTPDARRQSYTRGLTTQERTAVSLATVREGLKHRRWPKEIVEKFLAADIITYPLASRREASALGGVARRFSFLRASSESCVTIVSTLWR